MERKHQFRDILIIEDDLAQQPLWQHILTRSSDKKINIKWAVSAEQALTILRDSSKKGHKFDLIIVDLFLAGSETGLNFLTYPEVKKSKAKTILVSAANKDNLDGYVQSQVKNTKTIAKPLNVVRCERALNELIDEKAEL